MSATIWPSRFSRPGEVVNRLLRAWGRGDLQARDDLVPDHTLQPTALVHEAYLRLMRQDRVARQNLAHFFAMAAQMMRRILVDHAREHQAAKRPGAAMKLECLAAWKLRMRRRGWRARAKTRSLHCSITI